MPERRIEKRRLKRLRLKYGIREPERSAFTEDISSDGFFIKNGQCFFSREKGESRTLCTG